MPPKTSPAPAKVSIHLLYGNDVVKLNNARVALVDSLLSVEDRPGNLTDLRGPGNQALTLARALNDITGELGMIPLIPDMPRVMVVYDLADFYAGTKKPAAKPASTKKPAASAADAVAALERFFTTVMAQTPNVAIFVCEEEDDKSHQVDEASPLFRLVARLGRTEVFREKSIVWEFEDALYAGDVAAAIEVLRRWRQRAGSDSGARLKMYRSVAGFVEVILQARGSQEAMTRGASPGDYIPAAGYPSFSRLPDFRRRQASALARGFSFTQLRRAVEQANRLQQLMYPTGNEPYVADWIGLMEQLITELGLVAQGVEAAR